VSGFVDGRGAALVVRDDGVVEPPAPHPVELHDPDGRSWCASGRSGRGSSPSASPRSSPRLDWWERLSPARQQLYLLAFP
jgi:hypothetical protein